MAPSNSLPYAKDERVLCFHHELLYEAKILDSKLADANDKKSAVQYRVHYKGWKNTWDDWVPQDRLRKYTEENKDLAQQLKKDLDAQRRPSAPAKQSISAKKKTVGSDLSSTRGSEERHSSVPATGRGQKRGRDFEIEKVGDPMDLKPISPLRLDKTTSSSGVSRYSDFVHVNNRPSTSFPINSPNSQDAHTRTGPSSTSHVLFHNQLNSPTTLPALPTPSFQYGRRRNIWQMERDMDVGIGDERDDLLLPTAEVILSKSAPVDSRRKAMIGKQPEYPKARSAMLHPQLSKLNALDPANEAKRQFFKGQDPERVLMVAGYVQEFSIHPLRSASGGYEEEDGANGDINMQQEEHFQTRPAVRIVIPDHLKAILVDDWENVTKNLSLVPLPSKKPVNEILQSYFDEEKGKRRLGSAEADLLEEVVAGVKEYFEKCLGRILLYRFEREQFLEIRQLWEAGSGEWEGKGPGDAYGAEHLCRLFVSMPELIAQTNMDQQSVSRLREELAKLTQWLGKNSARFFTSEYESASQDYIEKARGV